jgi:hypothetical protein
MGLGSFVKKSFKKVAKKVKKVAGKVMGRVMKLPGMKMIGDLYAKTFGKLGPLGAIAAGLILPGIGSLISAGWTSIAGSLAGTSAGGIMQSVGTWVGKAATTLGKVGSSISDTVGSVFKGAGTSISDGASKVFNAASEWTKENLPKLHQNLSKAGDWISNKVSGTPATSAQQTRATLQANPELLKASAPQDVAANLFQSTDGTAAQNLLTKETLAANPEFAKFTDPSKTAAELAKTTQGRSTGTAFGLSTEPTGTGFAKKALEGTASLLSGMGAEGIEPMQPFQPSSFAEIGTQRGGIGGQGAVGGQFLTPAQQQFFKQHASLLGQVG